MNVASLELCRELYELSRWDDTEKWATNAPSISRPGKINYFETDYGGPLYDLGYLMRKLLNKNYDVRIRYSVNSLNWKASLIHYGNEKTADTPEDAAAKLAIELFKQGILAPQEPTV